MIIFGAVLLVGGLMAGVPALFTAGAVVVVLGLIIGVLGVTGHRIGGHEHWY